jgi:hypothetical protein
MLAVHTRALKTPKTKPVIKRYTRPSTWNELNNGKQDKT